MAVTVINKVNFQDAVNRNSYVTGTWTATNNLGYIADVATSGTITTCTAMVDTTGLTWVTVTNTAAFNTSFRVTRFRAMVASGATSGTTTANLGTSVSRGTIVISEVSGMDTTGTNGSGMYVQDASATLATATVSLKVSLPSAITAGNATLGIIYGNTTGTDAMDPKQGDSEISQGGPGTENGLNQTEWNATAHVTGQWSAGSFLWGGIYTELKLVAAGGAAVGFGALLGFVRNVMVIPFLGTQRRGIFVRSPIEFLWRTRIITFAGDDE